MSKKKRLTLQGGKYQSYDVYSKYGNKILLPKNYTLIIEYDEEDIPTEEDKIHRIDDLFYKNVFWPFVVSFFTTAGILFLAK